MHSQYVDRSFTKLSYCFVLDNVINAIFTDIMFVFQKYRNILRIQEKTSLHNFCTRLAIGNIDICKNLCYLIFLKIFHNCGIVFRTSIFSYFSMFEGKYLIEKIMESMANHICPNRAQRSLSKYCHFVPIKRCLKVLWTKDTKKLEMHSFHENRPYATV